MERFFTRSNYRIRVSTFTNSFFQKESHVFHAAFELISPPLISNDCSKRTLWKYNSGNSSRQLVVRSVFRIVVVDSINRDLSVQVCRSRNELSPAASICRVNVARLNRVVVVVWRPRSIRAESVILLLASRSKHLERYFQTRYAILSIYPSIPIRQYIDQFYTA